jgi:RNA polymerase sigma-70 factor (ECF subfamily)
MTENPDAINSFEPDAFSQVDDEILMQRVVNNRLVFGVLYQRHVHRVFRYAVVCMGNEQDAQDITAQTFLSVLENAATYTSQGKFVPWLMRIARNNIASFYRKQKLTEPLQDVEDKPSLDPMPDDIVDQNLQLERVIPAVRALSSDRAEALTLAIFSQLTINEIAQVMNRSESAIKMLLHRAVHDLQQRLAPQTLEEKYDDQCEPK